MNDARQRLLDALELCEKLRPFVDPGNTSLSALTDAWRVALDAAKRAAAEYAKDIT